MSGSLGYVLAAGVSLPLALPGPPALARSDRLEGQPENLEAGGDPIDAEEICLG